MNKRIGKVFSFARVPPSTTGDFFACRPVTISGTPAEAGTPTFNVDTSTFFFAYVTGGHPPAKDDYVLCHRTTSDFGSGPARDYWIAERITAGGGVFIGGCNCSRYPTANSTDPSLVTTLTLIVTNPSANGGIFNSCTLVYGNTPPEYAGLLLGAQCFLSNEHFTDQSGDTYRYHFYCVRSQFLLTRVYANSILGSPFEDSVRYSWTLGGANTCDPFSLTDGRIFSGGDTSTTVTITE